MVDKRANAKTLMNIFFVAILVLVLAVFVFAAANAAVIGADSLVTGGNYTGDTLLLNLTTTLNITGATNLNATCFYNSSGGDIYENYTGTVFGATSGRLDEVMWNGTTTGISTKNFTRLIDISGLIDSYTYNISCIVNNGSVNGGNWTSLTNVTIDNNPPQVNFTDTTSSVVNYGNYTIADLDPISINVSVADALERAKWLDTKYHNNTYVYIKLSNTTGQVNLTRARNLTRASVFYNMTFNLSSVAYVDGKYNITIYANDTMNDTLTNAGNLNDSEYIQITIDRVAPAKPDLAAGTGGTRDTNVITITTSDVTSGINNCVLTDGTDLVIEDITGTGTGAQTFNHTNLDCGRSYSYTVTCYDQAGNSAVSASESFSTLTCSTEGSSSGPSTVTAIENVNVFNVGSDEEATLTNFEEDMGIEEIKITVTEQANDVKVTVKKYSAQPEEITVPKTGNVHKYIQITSQNLANKMEKAILTIKVQKNWLLDNDISESNIAAFKLDEVAGQWNELLTVYKSEDADYYYYDAEVTSFSFFAIAEKVIGGEEEETEAKSLLWLWITIGIVVVALIVGGGFAAKKKK